MAVATNVNSCARGLLFFYRNLFTMISMKLIPASQFSDASHTGGSACAVMHGEEEGHVARYVACSGQLIPHDTISPTVVCVQEK